MRRRGLKWRVAKWTTLIALAFRSLAALPGMALDIRGFTRPDDASCWLDAACSLPRGGDSDFMTVFRLDGSIVAQIFAFGAEEADNLYYFDPAVVPVDPGQIGSYTTLLERRTVEWSDAFGVFEVPGVGPALAFMSDPQANPPPIGEFVFIDMDLSRPCLGRDFSVFRLGGAGGAQQQLIAIATLCHCSLQTFQLLRSGRQVVWKKTREGGACHEQSDAETH